MILGLDASFNSYGASVLDEKTDKVISLHLFQPLPPSKKEKKFNYRLNTAREMFGWLSAIVNQYQWEKIVIESQTGSQKASSAYLLGVVTGLTGASLYGQKCAIEFVSPMEITKACENVQIPDWNITAQHHKTIKKWQSIAWAFERYPNAPWWTDSKGRPYSKNQHCSDALIAINLRK